MGNAPVWLGTSPTSSPVYFDGLIDELRISRGILEPDEFLRIGKKGIVIDFK